MADPYFALAEDIRNARLLTLINMVGPAPTLQFFDVNAQLLASGQLPNQWLSDPIDGRAFKMGDWIAVASVEGVLDTFRLVANDVVRVVGGVALLSDTRRGPMIVDSWKTRRGYRINVIEFTLVEGNA